MRSVLGGWVSPSLLVVSCIVRSITPSALKRTKEADVLSTTVVAALARALLMVPAKEAWRKRRVLVWLLYTRIGNGCFALASHLRPSGLSAFGTFGFVCLLTWQGADTTSY